MKKDKKHIDNFIVDALAIESQDAQDAGAVGYMARALTQATMPHKKTVENTFLRKNGCFSLAMMGHPEIGLPYGSIPRLLVSWATTEAVRTKCPVLELGPSLSGFMAELGLVPTGGRWGSITRLKSQMERLFSSSVSCIYKDEKRTDIYNVNMVDEVHLWWDPQAPDQAPLWKSTVELGGKFYKEAIENPVPVDMRALKLLKRSPLALDIYCWLTHRMSYLRKPTVIPWGMLQLQFGSDYNRLRDFKAKFLEQLLAVQTVYPAVQVENVENGLLLKPSKPHIPPARKMPWLPKG